MASRRLNPISPEGFKERMKEIQNTSHDKECRHERADALLCEVLRSLGYEEGEKIFDQMEKWYS